VYRALKTHVIYPSFHTAYYNEHESLWLDLALSQILNIDSGIRLDPAPDK